MITESIDLLMVDSFERSEVHKITRTSWSWTSADPFAVKVEFQGGTSWTFAAELVIDGAKAPSGLADVQIWPSGEQHCRMRLESPEGFAVFELERAPLRYFGKQIIKAMPAQRAPSDDEINRCLDEWSRS